MQRAHHIAPESLCGCAEFEVATLAEKSRSSSTFVTEHDVGVCSVTLLSTIQLKCTQSVEHLQTVYQL